MYVWAKASTVVRWNGGIVRVNPDQVWPADDPFVTAHPELFAAVPPLLSTTRTPSGQIVRPVEAATAAPGERRAVKRAR